MKRFFLALVLVSFTICLKSQTNESKEQFLILNLSQIREGMNYGFVFSGPQFQYGRSWLWNKESVQYHLEAKLGAAMLSKKGPGYDFHLSPLNFGCLFNLNNRFWIGPCMISDYNYEFYPDMQAGHDFWFSHYSTGVSILFQKSFQQKELSVRFISALFGFTSRTPDDFDALFFDIGFRYAIKNLHKNMQLTSISHYRIFRFETKYTPLQARRVNISFLVDYFNYDRSPDWTRLNYGLKLSVHPKAGKP
jgi:hypothetical protein